MTWNELVHRTTLARGLENEPPHKFLRYLKEGEMAFAVDTECIETYVANYLQEGEGRIELPKSMLSVKRVDWKDKPLTNVHGWTLSENFKDTNGDWLTGTPESFMIFNDIMYLFPTPDTEGELHIWGTKTPGTLLMAISQIDYVMWENWDDATIWTGETIIPELQSQYLVGLTDYARGMLYIDNGDLETGYTYLGQFEKHKQKAKNTRRTLRHTRVYDAIDSIGV